MQQKGLFYAPYGALFGAVGIAAVNTLMGGVVSYPAFRVSRVCLAAQVQRRREDNYDLTVGEATCKSVSSCRKVSYDGANKDIPNITEEVIASSTLTTPKNK